MVVYRKTIKSKGYRKGYLNLLVYNPARKLERSEGSEEFEESWVEGVRGDGGVGAVGGIERA